MADHIVPLDGDNWRLLPMMPREWEWKRVWEHPEQVTPALWISASVPGTVQDDAFAAGLIPDFTVDFNSRACEWTSERDWVYHYQFSTPEIPLDGLVRLRFEGVDFECHVFLNGQHVGDHEGMYDAFEYEVTGLLNPDGPNNLVVVIEHAPREVGQIGRTSEVKIWKARFAYNWDWCTRLVPLGIIDSVMLCITGPAWIRDVQVRTVLDDDLAAADVGVEVQVGAAVATRVQVRTTLSCGRASVGEAEGSIVASGECTGASHVFRIERPQLWWPNGYGQQALYEAHVGLYDDHGRCLDQRTVPFGIRRVRAVANDGAPEGALPYVLEVNGQRVFIKGWNWAPISQLYGRPMTERYERWLKMAAHAHCNLLRVWGGGLLEKETFYDLCDRLGIMVWQEFIQSSSGIDNRPSTSPEYLAYIRDQAEKMIPRRRNHPSLVIWCGGNELMHDDWTPLDDTHPALATLKDCVRRLDPDRIFLPTSASGPSANALADKVGQMHDVHGPWQYQGPEEHYRLYNAIDPLLHSEFGVEGAANLTSMRRRNTESLLWPPDESNPLWLHRGAWWIQRAMMERVFGEIDNLELYVTLSQFLQAEGLRYAIESNRRRKWHCAGTSPWQYNESWPNLSCTNVMDFYGQPRPAYWWCRQAYEPLHPSARYEKLGWRPGEVFTADVWLNNSVSAIPGCRLSWELLDLKGTSLGCGEWLVDAPAGSAQQVGSLSWPVTELEGSLFILRLRVLGPDGHEAGNDYLFSTAEAPIFAPLAAAPRTEVLATRRGDAVELSNTGEVFAFFVRIEDAADGWRQPDRNYLLIAPAEMVRVECGAGLTITTGLNFTPRVV